MRQMSRHPELAVVILAGGASRRMGRPKADLLLPSGAPVIQQLRATAESMTFRVLVAGPPGTLPGLPHVPDEGEGPLGGILAAVNHTQAETLLVLPCDMPALTSDLLEQLVVGLEGHDACHFNGVPQGPTAVLPLGLRGRVAPVIRDVLINSQRSIHALLDRLHVNQLELTPNDYHRLVNINSPADWQNFLDAN